MIDKLEFNSHYPTLIVNEIKPYNAELMKAIYKDLSEIAVKHKIVIITATQIQKQHDAHVVDFDMAKFCQAMSKISYPSYQVVTLKSRNAEKE